MVLVFIIGLILVVGNELLSPAPNPVQLVVGKELTNSTSNSSPLSIYIKPAGTAPSSVLAMLVSGVTYFFRALFAGAGKFFVFFVPVLGVLGAVIAWAYQSGSTRLGVIDLFACEISTLCRVATVVDTARRYAGKFDRPPSEPADADSSHSPPPHHFTSQENYFPVFESNTRDLQALEARVVVNITEFYTYMKAFRDYLRTLAEITPQPELDSSPSESLLLLHSWHEAVVNVVFMLFLSLESARHAIADLVEFQPEKAERTIVILISELEAYRFLRSQFTNEQDVRYQRLNLRESNYQGLVPKLIKWVEEKRAEEKRAEEKRAEEKRAEEKRAEEKLTIDLETEWDHPPEVSKWEPAVRLLPGLKARYQACADLWDRPQKSHESAEALKTIAERPRRRPLAQQARSSVPGPASVSAR